MAKLEQSCPGDIRMWWAWSAGSKQTNKSLSRTNVHTCGHLRRPLLPPNDRTAGRSFTAFNKRTPHAAFLVSLVFRGCLPPPPQRSVNRTVCFSIKFDFGTSFTDRTATPARSTIVLVSAATVSSSCSRYTVPSEAVHGRVPLFSSELDSERCCCCYSACVRLSQKAPRSTNESAQNGAHGEAAAGPVRAHARLSFTRASGAESSLVSLCVYASISLRAPLP